MPTIVLILASMARAGHRCPFWMRIKGMTTWVVNEGIMEGRPLMRISISSVWGRVHDHRIHRPTGVVQTQRNSSAEKTQKRLYELGCLERPRE
ncbi:uncharacterized protein BT62DRAFT_336819 [Guyanagaster necrorhizus]|uniref:Uncharacterized protein n=1 Tax=Guyanagaster necrorhizus TaxID=856835 RepID=A0A9P7VM50_9AGAR|nr:uncharacterized protein BT62DRAFT_336819 [Guyanagaster necrorhizus MCA 3950]KAG7443229.1 hypothetical protein BT62DRAFT_336819 [Guyanagaster necrorhizus MCA 3950]